MSVIRDLRERVEALEEQEIECTCDCRWAEVAPYLALFGMLAVVAMSAAYAAAHAPPDRSPPVPNPSVECVKVGGAWSWGSCQPVKK